MSLGQLALTALAVIVIAVVLVIRAKRISPLGWGWHGRIQTLNGYAVAGHDPVAYFSGQSVPGKDDITLDWGGVRWRFASAANRAAFQAEPERYAPQFGGFCAFASSKGFTARIDPAAWRVEDGKLYLFNDAKFRDRWTSELGDGVIERARSNWKSRL